MRFLSTLAFLAFVIGADARELVRPHLLETSDLKGFEQLGEKRRELVTKALEIRKQHGWLKYQFGSADPAQGGFDCSGAMFHLLTELGYTPPRTSSQQFDWIRENSELFKIPKSVRKVTHSSFKNLKPGDLLFWSGTYRPTDGRTNKITHVGMYLGREKSDGHPVMICSSKGRSYRRKGQNGYGVFSFKLPREKSKSRFVGYGSVPGID